MVENANTERLPVQDLIDEIRSQETYKSQFVAERLEEVFLSGKYGVAVLGNIEISPEDKEVLKGIVIASIWEGQLIFTPAILKDGPKGKEVETRLRERARNLKIKVKAPDIERVALEVLERDKLKSVGVISLSTKVETGEDFFQIYYPKTFANMLKSFDTSATQEQALDGAFDLACVFLKKDVRWPSN